MNIQEIIKDFAVKEVRYIDPRKVGKEEPLKDSETIKVYHGFYSMDDVETTLTKGLSGKDRAKRIYSYESGNNPYGLFVTINFKVAKEFASSGVIIEFSTKVSDLEAPVWVDGRSYYVQGEYTKSFKDLDDREKQRLINRQKSGESPYDYISKSDRPELATTIFDNPEKQALFIGDLDPNMIKNVWYNEVLHKDRLTNGEWERMGRKDFLKKMSLNKKSRSKFDFYFPNDNFDYDEFVEKGYDGNKEDLSLKYFVEFIADEDNIDELKYQLRNSRFYPKQIADILKLKEEGFFDNLLNSPTGKLEEVKLVKKRIVGSGTRQNVYDLVGRPNMIVKTRSDHKPYTDEQTMQFMDAQQHPDIFAKIYIIKPTFVVMEKLDIDSAKKKYIDVWNAITDITGDRVGDDFEYYMDEYGNMSESDFYDEHEDIFDGLKKRGLLYEFEELAQLQQDAKLALEETFIDFHENNIGMDKYGNIKLVDW